jgi:hypothetical protein
MHRTKNKKHRSDGKTIKAPKSTKSITINATNKACPYKKSNGSINVSKYMRCVTNDVLKKQLGNPKYIYEINDNATFPFVVFDYGGGNASIYNNRFNEVTNRGELKGKLMDVKYEQLFLGDNGTNDPYWRVFERGNNILFQTGKGKYLFIGKGILSFSARTGDTIRRFYSPMGGNYDSFPYAVGDKYVYLLNDKKCAPISEFDMTKDIIRQYYCYETGGECKKYKTSALPMKTVYAPFYGYY